MTLCKTSCLEEIEILDQLKISRTTGFPLGIILFLGSLSKSIISIAILPYIVSYRLNKKAEKQFSEKWMF